MYDNPELIFESAEDYYLKYRMPYSTVLIQRLMKLGRELWPLPIVDVGTGTGLLARDLQSSGLRVVALDPNPRMLELAAGQPSLTGMFPVTWFLGVGEEIHKLDLSFGLVTYADSFHWTDRLQALTSAAIVLAAEGHIGVLCSQSRDAEKPWWEPILTKVRDAYLGESRPAGRLGGSHDPGAIRHEEIMRREGWREITIMDAPYALNYSLDELLGLQLSQSFSSPAVLGRRMPDFLDSVKTELVRVGGLGPYHATAMNRLITAKPPLKETNR